MKISRFLQLASLLTVFLGLALIPCNGKTPKSRSENSSAKSAVCTCSLSFNKDLLSVADVKITYYDASGKKQTEQITDSVWSKTLTIVTFPSKIGVKLNFTANGKTLTKDSCDFAYRCISSVIINTKKNENLKTAFVSNSFEMDDVQAANMHKFFVKNDGILNVCFNVVKTTDDKQIHFEPIKSDL